MDATGNTGFLPVHIHYIYYQLLKFILHHLYYIKKQLDATLAVLFISHCKITLYISDAFCVHHQEY